jgi:hypothetical protein
MAKDSNPNSGEKGDAKKGIPLRWIFYAILSYAFLQTFYVWWQVKGE